MIVVRADEAHLRALLEGATLATSSPAIFRIEGPGAVACMQGVFTNDLVKPGAGHLSFGALLTPKGMIVVPCWVLRDGDTFTLVAPAEARAAALEFFRRQLPPRLARVTDRTPNDRALWLLGPGSHTDGVLGLHEEPGRVAASTTAAGTLHGPLLVARGTRHAWFRALAIGSEGAVDAAAAALAAAGARHGSADDLEMARILAGWPALGAEIDDKTLPQEVRFDELEGVSYTKGCYTGQETVARVHFRGHPNRELRGLLWRAGMALEGELIVSEEKPVGTVRSVIALPGRSLGLAPLRREVTVGSMVLAAGHPALVVPLPFEQGITAA